MTDMSPYLRARHAARPAIYAQRLLVREQERAGALAAECEELLSLTRELLLATGRARLLADPPESPRPFEQNTLLDAYADAGIAWARVVGSLMALSGTLLDLGEWAEVRRLAAVLADIGEANAAVDLRIQLGKAVWDRHYDHLRRIHARMTPQEIAGSLATLRAVLRDVPEDFPERNREVNRLLVPVASAIYELLRVRAAEIPLDSRVGHIATGGVAKYPEIVAVSLDELAAEFEGLVSDDRLGVRACPESSTTSRH
ncbi:MAG TPA: hypothetical protein VFB06_26790 [Streptosporangiaceae bacterium]|nr:hypothetical protein [Streptosporangiaceae bacterium]